MTVSPQTWAPGGWVLTPVPWSPAQGMGAGPLRPLLGCGVMRADFLKKDRAAEVRRHGGQVPPARTSNFVHSFRIKSVCPSWAGMEWTFVSTGPCPNFSQSCFTLLQLQPFFYYYSIRFLFQIIWYQILECVFTLFRQFQNKICSFLANTGMKS